MKILSSLTKPFIAYCFLFLVCSVNAASTQEIARLQQMTRAPTPEWVMDVEVSAPKTIPTDQIKNGVYYLLSDRQMKIGDSSAALFYNHYADYIVNQNGLDSSSQINVSFDPNYQTLTFHRLHLIRNGQSIDKLRTAKYSVLQREQDLEKLIYDGRLSANIILDDVRVGDVVEYSYTIAGTNPVYGNNFSNSFYTQWSVPLAQQVVRVLWEKSKPLQITPINNSVMPVVTRQATGVEYLLRQNAVAPLIINTQVPSWYDPYPWVMLTDSQNWQTVVDWALPLYRPAVQTVGEPAKIAADIMQAHQSTDARIHAALAFVQSEIRYLGLEMGENSHKPSPATETLQRRYGDCKDKTVLLISLLAAMKIEAHPALVNTKIYKELAKYSPATTAFDHVIVYLRHKGKDFWIDPTRQYQQSKLEELHQPDFGYALIVAPGQSALTSMAADRLAKQVVIDEFDLREGIHGTANYTIVTHYYGWEAERRRNSLASSSNDEIAQQYLNYYKGYYPNITALAPLEVVDEHPDFSLSVTERYELENIWEASEGNRFTLGFYANSIGAALVKVNETKRNSPFSLPHPYHVVQTIKIKLADRNWSFDDDKVTEKNPFFEYSSHVKFDKSAKILTLHYDYKTLTNHVPAEQIAAYIKARKKVVDDIEYSIFDRSGASHSDTGELDDTVVILLLIAAGIIYIVLIVFVIVSWTQGKNRSNTYRYLRYVMSVVVVLPPLVLTLASVFGLFPSYRVVTGEEIAQRDIKFMQRSNVISANEKILYFYSDHFFDIRRDGNGLTDEQIFSYWRDEDGSFNLEQAALQDIERYEFADAETWFDNATLKLYREDASHFVLYLSTEADGHQTFRKGFESRWRKARLNSEVERAFSKDMLQNAELESVRKPLRHMMAKAIFGNDLQSQLRLAELYSQGIVLQQNIRRALYFYERAAAHDDERAITGLAWHLAVADQRIQNPERALILAYDLLEREDSARVRELLAAANAAAGNFPRAQAEQLRALDMMSEAERRKFNSAEKLVEYQNSRPWIQLWPDSLKNGESSNVELKK